jgi:hypothetical protein
MAECWVPRREPSWQYCSGIRVFLKISLKRNALRLKKLIANSNSNSGLSLNRINGSGALYRVLKCAYCL